MAKICDAKKLDVISKTIQNDYTLQNKIQGEQSSISDTKGIT